MPATNRIQTCVYLTPEQYAWLRMQAYEAYKRGERPNHSRIIQDLIDKARSNSPRKEHQNNEGDSGNTQADS